MKNRLFLISLIVAPFIFFTLATLGLFKFLGVSYKSNGSLFLFLILLVFIEFVIDNISEIIFYEANHTSSMYFVRSIISIYLADSLLASVSVSFDRILLISLVFTVADYFIEKLDE